VSSPIIIRAKLEKNFTSSNFEVDASALVTTPPTGDRKDPQAEYDRLMHNRKGKSGSEFAGIGMQFAVTLVLFTLAGVWLDKRLGTSPWLLILLALGGSGVAFWVMYRRMISSGKK
jgi:F0F1-type ATP synthase assembly protein I